ncbi:COG0863 DNA modification methylase [uncultured Caudovirales phage]|uniref:COG0863 DNA modification methylase n=1 Tax=uncultured Caudovirales phage TaxID=2100421 RepID=A0A6J5P022_9CAUD|nr:COG0863 DNA modification methylase [uncultured Caudovirales phage]
MINWTPVVRKIKDLKEYAKNPRILHKKDEEHIRISIEKFGMADPVIINLDDTIIGGHQRIRTLKKLKVATTLAMVPDRLLNEKEIEELCIRLNRNHGSFDFEALGNNFEMQELLEWGFAPEELLEDLKDITELEAVEEDEDTLSPGEDKDAITKLGDVYELNNHRLVCGDSTNPEFVSKCLDGKEPILMVTDPPYGVEYDPSWRKDIKGKHGVAARALGKVQNDDKVNWALAWHLFPGSVAYVWHAGKYCGEVEKSLTDSEYEIISQIVWVKQHFALSRGDYHWQHEPCWYAVRKGHPHNWQGSRKEATTWEIANLNCFGKSKEDGEERTAHSTQKPIECMARPIRNNTASGEGVYDPFLGSGSTLIAAEQLERICYGIELSPAYCDIIVERWKKYMIKSGKTYTIKKNGEIQNG